MSKVVVAVLLVISVKNVTDKQMIPIMSKSGSVVTALSDSPIAAERPDAPTLWRWRFRHRIRSEPPWNAPGRFPVQKLVAFALSTRMHRSSKAADASVNAGLVANRFKPIQPRPSTEGLGAGDHTARAVKVEHRQDAFFIDGTIIFLRTGKVGSSVEPDQRAFPDVRWCRQCHQTNNFQFIHPGASSLKIRWYCRWSLRKSPSKRR